jgi:uncharacterized protein (TIGR02266 family)
MSEPSRSDSKRTEMSAPALLATKTVVVADDTAFVRERFKAAIDGGGHRAVTVSTGAELLHALRGDASDCDLIVVDLRLPQGRGIELVRAIRKITERPPIIVFSGTIASAEEVRDLAALGVAGYINEYTTGQHILPALAPHLFPEQYNRRSSPRVVLGIPVAYRFGNTIAAALTLNISKGGLAIRTTSPLDIGTMLKVRFRISGARKEIEADARVAWVDRRMGMGVQFVRVDPADHAAIEQFVQSHFFSNRKA